MKAIASTLCVLAAVLLGVAHAATKTRTIPYEDTTIQATNGSFRRLPDGTYRFETCAEVRQPDGGTIVVKEPCVSCTGSFSLTTLSACLSTWKSVNEFP